MHSQEEMNDLIIRLKDYYPHRADEASDILLHEYNFPMQLAASIMHIVRMLVEKNNCMLWPPFDASNLLFYVN
tara:strand:- start:276 stop:494 length:219 start_codon:yes stop_codon:yes gene_type:complete